MKKLVAMLGAVLSLAAFAGDVSVTGVTARQRYPWNGLVDIVVTLQGSVENVAKADCLFAATNSATKAAIPVEHVTRNGDDTGSGNVWTRKFIWDAKADVGTVKIDDVALTVDVEVDYGGVQLWENGPYWAECNVGAKKPEECGYYFWWGDTVGYKRNASNDGWVSVKDDTGFSFNSGNCPTYGKSNSKLQSDGYIDATGNLMAKYDAATAHLGAPWRMPTDAEFSALINNCDTEWTSRNGVSGRLVKGRGAYSSKSIFLPAAGYGYDSGLSHLGSYGAYRSSTPDSDDSGYAWGLYFGSGNFFRYDGDRSLGPSVRPVRGFASSSVTVGGVTTHLSLDCSVGTVSVTGVTARQRYPWNGLVDIVVTLQGSVENVAKADCLFAATNSATKAAIPVEHITRNGDDTGSGNVWTRKFIWDAKADVGAVRIDDVALTVDLKPLGGVQLWENGPYWAECNVGASQPEECGYYFWWGDTVGYKRNANNDGWISVKDSTGFSFNSGNCQTYGKNNSQLKSAGYIDATGNLVAKYDAATAHLGASWRMPMDAEFFALINNCDREWTSRNSVFGWLVKGRGSYSSKNIFLPAAGIGDGSGFDLYSYIYYDSYGYYWSSTPNSDFSNNAAWRLGFNWNNFVRDDYSDRYYGQTVRPVRGFASSSVTVGGVTTHLSLDCSVGTVSVTGVTAQQRYPWNGLVDITVTIQGAAEDVAKADCLFAATNSATKAAIPVEHITRNGDDTGSDDVWTRKFVWDAKADIGAVKIDDVALTVDAEIPLGGVRLWENGPYWAECNVGASQPEECGYYFWWGDTVGYKRNANGNGWISAKDFTSFSFSRGNCPTYRKNNSQLQSAGYIDATGNLAAKYDAATAHLGAPWRMPTDAEFSALMNNCTTTWTTRNGVPGRLVTGKGTYSLKSIFLAAAGFGSDSSLSGLGSNGSCRSSTPSSDYSDLAWRLYFSSGGFSWDDRGSRCNGLSVRPVRGFAKTLGGAGSGVVTHFVWGPPTCTVVFNANGGCLSTSSKQYFCGLMLETLPTATWGGYEFLGWYTAASGGTQVTAATIAEEDTTLYAHWRVDENIRNGGPYTETVDGIEWVYFIVDGEAMIGQGDWYAAKMVGEIEIPSVLGGRSVTSIGDYAFYGCSGLKLVMIPSSVTSVGDFAFVDCSGLASVEIPEGVTSIGTLTFSGCGGLASVMIPSSVTSIGVYAFESCSGLTSVTIPEGVTSIGYYAFSGCSGLTSVTIPSSVMSIGDYSTFSGCEELEAIAVSGDNKAYASVDGILYNKTKTELIRCPEGKSGSVTIPSSVTSIGESAFGGCSGLMSVTIPSGVTSIGKRAFEACSALKVIYVSNAVKQMLQASGFDVGGVTFVSVLVTSVTAQQRYPWNGLVDIAVTLQGTAEDVAEVECFFAATNLETKAAIPVEHVTCSGADSGSGTVWVRKFVWDAAIDVGEVKIEDVELTVDAKIFDYVQLWKDGPCWAKCNVGATKPEECGYYFWWGDTVGYKRNPANYWVSVKDGSWNSFDYSFDGGLMYGKDNSQLQSEGYIDSSSNLVAAYDAATAHLDAPWRMPTAAEFSALINNCTTIWTTRNGVFGRLFTGKGAYSSKSIFLPAAGYGQGSYLYHLGSYGHYWSSTPDSNWPNYAWNLEFDSDYFGMGGGGRFYGLSVRPVRGFAGSAVEVAPGVTTYLSVDCREGVKVSDKMQTLVYDVSWCADGVTAKIMANGQEIVSGTTGTCEWMPSTDGVNLLTLNVYNDSDEIVGTESVFYLSREDLTELEIPEGTTEIGDYTFADGRFTSAMIPSSVTSIGDGAFFNCSRLISISVDEGNASYCSVDGVLYDKAKKELICHPARKSGYMAIPEGVTSIVDYAFYGCSGLTSVTIPSSVTRIGESAFSGCDGLEKVYVFAGDVKRVKELLVASGSELDVDSLTFVEEGKPYKDTVDGIEWTFTISKGKAILYGHYERVNSQSVVSTAISSATQGVITIPETLGGYPVTSIGDYAFYCCSGLTSVTIPEGVTSIGRLAFFYCGGLVSLTIPEGVTNIGNSAFEQCDNLREVIIPSSVIDMGEGAFWGCTALQSIAIPSGVGVIRQETFYNCISLCSIILHEGLREIGEYAFVHCDSLEMITFPSTLSAVTDGMFSGCERLRAVYYCSVLPPSVMLGSGYGYYRGLYDGASTSLLSIVPWMPSGDEWQGRQWLQWTPPPGGTGTGDDEEQSCVVVFDANGGSCSISSNQYVIGEELGELPDATREGYAFEGWFTEATGGEQVTAATVVTEDVTFYAQWSAEIIAMPVVDPPNGTVFRADDCLVTITTETDGAAIYYRVGAAPKASSKFLYSAPFTIVDTSTIYTYAMKEGRSSATNVVTITKGEVLTFAEAASAEGITTFITDGDAEWIAEEDANAKVGNASVRSGEIDDDQISWFTAEVEGPGTLSFWWKASCEADELQEFDHLVFAVDDVVEGEIARLDGITAWEQVTTTVSAGTHTLYWAYVKDESDFDGEDCGWVDGIVWTPSAAPVVGPTIEGDEGATVTGDAETGFVVKPSERKTAVVVTIPQGVDAAKVTVEVSVKVTSVKPNGAKVKMVNAGADITEFLNVPAADGSGVVDLTKATVKEEIVKEAMDPAKGAEIKLNAADPKLKTAPTRVGLFYQLREGGTLGGMKDGDSKVGDGEAWTPNITVKGGNSAFYSIGVGKGE